jgi:serine/threonine protein kinase
MECSAYASEIMSTKRNSKAALKEGTEIARYTITDQALHGYPEDVYVAHDNNLNRNVLLQFLPGKYGADREIRDAFRRVAQKLAAVSHPNLLHIYEVAEYEGRPYVVMEYVGRRTLFDILREGSLSVSQGLDIAIRICSGLEALHEAGIIYRDLRPDSIAVSKTNQVQLLLFGHLLIESTGDRDETGEMSGLGSYAAPELGGGRENDISANIFSLGVIIFEMFAGKLPFSGTGRDTSRILADGLTTLVRNNPRIPRELHLIIEKALGESPEARYLRNSEPYPEIHQPAVG